jgi:hypothetical protein
MFLLSLTAPCQVWIVSLKAGLNTYKAVEPTPNSVRSCVAPASGRGSPRALLRHEVARFTARHKGTDVISPGVVPPVPEARVRRWQRRGIKHARNR